MRAIEDANLAGAVGLQIVSPDDIQPRLVQRELFSKRLRTFDHPDMERLSSNEQRIVVAPLFIKAGGFVTRIARHDAVNQRVAEMVGAFYPLRETGFQIPARCKLEHDFFELAAVGFDEFARQENQTRRSLAA